MKPIIGITAATGWEKNREFSKASHYYANSVRLGGGLPTYIPIINEPDLAEHYMNKLDGLLLSGGDEDVHPHYYGEGPIRGINHICPDRDIWEFALIKAALSQNKPILGICRGCQVLNVALGGNLFQSLRKQYPGAGEHYPMATEMHHLYHSVKIEPDSLLQNLFGSELMVNSFHHLALKDLAPCFKVTARSNEGVIEAVESQEHPFVVGIQWHPEALTKHHPHFVKLFKAHVDACNEE